MKTQNIYEPHPVATVIKSQASNQANHMDTTTPYPLSNFNQHTVKASIERERTNTDSIK